MQVHQCGFREVVKAITIRAKSTPETASVTSQVKETPTDRKRWDVKFESLQNTLLEHEKHAEKSQQVADKAARAEQHDLLLHIEGMTVEAEDKCAREKRAWQAEQRKKEQEYDEKKERKRREYAERKKGSAKNTRGSGKGSRTTMLRSEEQEKWNCMLHCLLNIARSREAVL